MSTATLGTSRPAAAAEGVQLKAAARLLFVDNIRIFLTILVILHHTMIVYAGTGSFLYNEGRQDTITSVLGEWFCTVNQAYFMSLFLLISAYFVPGSYDRKGAGRLVEDRLIRLGIPLIIYSWIIMAHVGCHHLRDARSDLALVDLPSRCPGSKDLNIVLDENTEIYQQSKAKFDFMKNEYVKTRSKEPTLEQARKMMVLSYIDTIYENLEKSAHLIL